MLLVHSPSAVNSSLKLKIATLAIAGELVCPECLHTGLLVAEAEEEVPGQDGEEKRGQAHPATSSSLPASEP